MSTHYIEEAKQSDRIGLMRNGVLIAEDSPRKIMMVCGTENMEEAFLKLSQKQEFNNEDYGGLINDCELENDRQASTSNWNFEEKVTNVKKQTPMKIMKALLIKHYLEISRNFRLA